MRTRTLECEVWLPHDPSLVFPFFSAAGNLDAITPGWLHFRMITSPDIEVREGTLLEYKLRLRGIPIRWTSEITDWHPPFRFVDEQRKGPYRKWIHTHTFAPEREGTRMNDHVEYALPGGLFEPYVEHLLVRPDLEKIFTHRSQVILKKFNGK